MSEPVKCVYSANGRRFHAVKVNAEGKATGRMLGTATAEKWVGEIVTKFADGLPLEKVGRVPKIRNDY